MENQRGRDERLIEADRLIRSAGHSRYVRYFDDFPVDPTQRILGRHRASRLQLTIRSMWCRRYVQDRRALHPHDHRPRRPRARSDLRLRHDGLCRRAMGPALDHHRHLARRTRARPRPHHGRALSLLPAGRLSRKASARRPRSRALRRRASPTRGDIRQGFVYERVPHITLKSIANNAEIDVIWEQWQAKLEPLREALNKELARSLGGVGNPARGRGQWSSQGEATARRLVAGAHRAAEGDRRLDRRQGRVRIPLRQALRRQEARARGRAVHGGEPVAAPRAGGG